MKRSACQKKNQTFDDIQRSIQVHTLNEKDRRVLSFLKVGNTQSQTVQKGHIPKSTVSQIVKKLEEAGLIRKRWAGFYNILYDVFEPAVEQSDKKEEPEQKFTNIRTHNVAMKFKIERQNNQLSLDKRTGYEKHWSMRGKKDLRYAYWFPGKEEQADFTVTVHHKTLVVRMDKGGKIRAPSGVEAKIKGYQLAANAIKQFCAKQREFGIIIETSSTGKIIDKAHGGFILKEGTVAERAGVRNKEWWIDASVSEVKPGYKELESTVFENELTPLDHLINVSKDFVHLPDLIRSAIDPLRQGIDSMTAHIQAGTTSQYKINEQNTMILHLLKVVDELQKEIKELKRK